MLISSKHCLYAVCKLIVLSDICYLICNQRFVPAVCYCFCRPCPLLAVPGRITASIASRLSISAFAPTTSCSILSLGYLHSAMPATCLKLLSIHRQIWKSATLHLTMQWLFLNNRCDAAVSQRPMCLKALPGSVQELMQQPSYLTQFVALDAGAESKACSEEPSGDCRPRSGERCEEHHLPGSFCGHLLCSHILAPKALLLGPQAALLCCR